MRDIIKFHVKNHDCIVLLIINFVQILFYYTVQRDYIYIYKVIMRNTYLHNYTDKNSVVNRFNIHCVYVCVCACVGTHTYTHTHARTNKHSHAGTHTHGRHYLIYARKGNFPFDEIMTKFSKGASDNKIACVCVSVCLRVRL